MFSFCLIWVFMVVHIQPAIIKSVSLTTSNTNDQGATISILRAVDVDTTNNNWDITCTQEIEYHLGIDLDSSWGFHPSVISTHTFDIYSPKDISTTDMGIVVTFSVNDNEFITVKLRVDTNGFNVMGPWPGCEWQSCTCDGSDTTPTTPLGTGDVKSCVDAAPCTLNGCSTNCNGRREDKALIDYLGNGGADTIMDPVTLTYSAGSGDWPISIILINDPVNNYLFVRTTTSLQKPSYTQCGYQSFTTNAGIQIYVASDKAGENPIFSKFDIQYEANVSNPDPTQTPSEIPSRIPSQMPSKTPTKVPSELPSEVPSKAPSEIPSETPTKAPSDLPSEVPSKQPSKIPSTTPTNASSDPTQSLAPSAVPSVTETIATPTNAPQSIFFGIQIEINFTYFINGTVNITKVHELITDILIDTINQQIDDLYSNNTECILNEDMYVINITTLEYLFNDSYHSKIMINSEILVCDYDTQQILLTEFKQNLITDFIQNIQNYTYLEIENESIYLSAFNPNDYEITTTLSLIQSTVFIPQNSEIVLEDNTDNVDIILIIIVSICVLILLMICISYVIYKKIANNKTLTNTTNTINYKKTNPDSNDNNDDTDIIGVDLRNNIYPSQQNNIDNGNNINNNDTITPKGPVDLFEQTSDILQTIIGNGERTQVNDDIDKIYMTQIIENIQMTPMNYNDKDEISSDDNEQDGNITSNGITPNIKDDYGHVVDTKKEGYIRNVNAQDGNFGHIVDTKGNNDNHGHVMDTKRNTDIHNRKKKKKKKDVDFMHIVDTNGNNDDHDDKGQVIDTKKNGDINNVKKKKQKKKQKKKKKPKKKQKKDQKKDTKPDDINVVHIVDTNK